MKQASVLLQKQSPSQYGHWLHMALRAGAFHEIHNRETSLAVLTVLERVAQTLQSIKPRVNVEMKIV